MKLFASLTSPYARKIRIVLAEKQLPFELIVDSPWESNTRVPELNPLGKVPALVADDGEVFFDSPVVAGYLETLGAPPRLVPEGAMDAVRVRQIEALADGVTDAAVAALLETRRLETQRSSDVMERELGRVERGLAELERRIAGKTWFHGDAMTLGDIAVGVALAYLDLRFPEREWRAAHPALTEFGERMFARASFADTKPPVG